MNKPICSLFFPHLEHRQRIGSISSINNRIVIAGFLSISIPPGQQLPKRCISESSSHSPSPSRSSSPILIRPPHSSPHPFILSPSSHRRHTRHRAHIRPHRASFFSSLVLSSNVITCTPHRTDMQTNHLSLLFLLVNSGLA